MKIGIKYCGGCNPMYDRKKEVEHLKEMCPGCMVEIANKAGEYDRVFLVCGCMRTCIRDSQEIKTQHYDVMQGRADFEKMIKELSCRL